MNRRSLRDTPAGPADPVARAVGASRTCRSGDVVNFDIAVFKDGVFGDNSMMVTVGDVDEEGRRAVARAHPCPSDLGSGLTLTLRTFGHDHPGCLTVRRSPALLSCQSDLGCGLARSGPADSEKPPAGLPRLPHPQASGSAPRRGTRASRPSPRAGRGARSASWATPCTASRRRPATRPQGAGRSS